jgi:hypothetical protein
MIVGVYRINIDYKWSLQAILSLYRQAVRHLQLSKLKSIFFPQWDEGKTFFNPVSRSIQSK